MTFEEFKTKGGKEYEDWFGKGNTLRDCLEINASFHKNPSAIYESEVDFMILAEYDDDDAAVVTGYDGNEYRHTFVFKKGPPSDRKGKR